ncbi:PTS system protein [Klebsiella pneumoniae]|nr:PTS system protein [Klebsiella pneumoniae]
MLFGRHVHQPADEKNDCGSRTAGLPVEINAYGVAEFAEQVGHYQVVLLGPQVKYMQQDLQKQADKYGIRVEPINMMDYGMQKGAAVLDFALSLIENKN